MSTAVRELHEETGVIVAPNSLSLAGVIHGARGVEAPNGFLTLVFVARSWSGEPVNAEPHKHSQVGWCDTDQVPSKFVPTTRQALLSYLSGHTEVVIDGFPNASAHRTLLSCTEEMQ